MSDRLQQAVFIGGIILILASTVACGRDRKDPAAPDLPRGYTEVLCLDSRGSRYCFGPFVGYYFKPVDPGDLSRLKFICLNEEGFYTSDLPDNSRIFEGEARLARLPDTGDPLPDTARISPVFFKDAPRAWRNSRPGPRNEFVHFHSCYDSQGPVLTGFWLRHRALADFTYDMGGRVGESSPLYHRTFSGPDRAFPRLIEFDRGPGQ